MPYCHGMHISENTPYRNRAEAEAHRAGETRRLEGLSWEQTLARIVAWYGNVPRLIEAARDGYEGRP